MQDDSPFSESREATRDRAHERGGYSSEKLNEDTLIKRRICITTGFTWDNGMPVGRCPTGACDLDDGRLRTGAHGCGPMEP